ncbi:MAG: hypothetical protein V6013_00765 [Candidatus Dasytiphilus stammeri]
MSNDTTFSKMQKELHHLLNSLEEMINNSDNKTPNEIDTWCKKARVILDEAKQSLGESQKHIWQQSRAVAHLANDYLRENPWAGLSIGAAVGLILGVILMRR